MSSLYCGIDLHSNNHVVVVINEEDKRLYEKRLPNDLSLTLQALEPFKDHLVSTIVESTFNWYWLVDGLIDHGYNVELANPTACAQQYSGLKYSDDKHDAFWLAHMRRLGILPTGYIYPPEQRAVRDMLRRRLQLVGMRSKQLTGIQTQIWRSTGVRVKSGDIKKKTFTISLNFLIYGFRLTKGATSLVLKKRRKRQLLKFFIRIQFAMLTHCANMKITQPTINSSRTDLTIFIVT